MPNNVINPCLQPPVQSGDLLFSRSKCPPTVVFAATAGGGGIVQPKNFPQDFVTIFGDAKLVDPIIEVLLKANIQVSRPTSGENP
jgi:hypothetical protein